MGEEHFFAKGGFVDGRDDFGGHAGEFSVAAMVGAIEDEGNERRARGEDFVTELKRKVVTEGSGADLGDREAPGGDDENRSAKFVGIGAEHEFGGTDHFGNARVGKNLHVRGVAFGFEKVGYVGSRIVAEELAESFLVVGDVVAFDESDEIFWSEAREGGFGEVGVGGEKIFGRGVKVGEIAASAAGDEDFLADAIGEFKEAHTATAFGGFDGAEQASGTGAEDEDIKGARHSARSLGEKRCEHKRGTEKSVERRGKFGMTEMMKEVGNLRRRDAGQGKRRDTALGKEFGVGGLIAVLRSTTGEFGEEKEFVGMKRVRRVVVKVAIEQGREFSNADFVARFLAGFPGRRNGGRLTDIGPSAGQSPKAVREFADKKDAFVPESGDANIDFGSGIAGLLGEELF